MILFFALGKDSRFVLVRHSVAEIPMRSRLENFCAVFFEDKGGRLAARIGRLTKRDQRLL